MQECAKATYYLGFFAMREIVFCVTLMKRKQTKMCALLEVLCVYLNSHCNCFLQGYCCNVDIRAYAKSDSLVVFSICMLVNEIVNPS